MKKIHICLILFFLFLYIIPLGIRPMVMPDETRYGEIPREMIATGDWVVPHFNGLRYFEKPVMGYWLNALAIKAFGENSFSVRFPSALAVGFTSIAIFLCVYHFTRKTATGLMAAGIYLSCLEIFGVGVFSVLDSVVSFFLTASLVAFFFAWINRRSTGKYIFFLIVSGLFCGLACHTKGFLAFVIPAAVIVPFILWEKEWKQLMLMPWIPLITAGLVVLPWGLLIYKHEPDFWNYFFWNEHVRRFLAGNAQHKKSFLYYFLIFPLGSLPWVALWPAAASGFEKEEKQNSLYRFSFCWLVFSFLFFSACSGKLATYILPCFPPMAILMSLGLSGYFRQGKKKAFNRGIMGLIIVLMILITGLFAIQLRWGANIKGWVADTQGYQNPFSVIILIVVLLVFAGWVIASGFTKNNDRKWLYILTAPLCFYLSIHFLLPDQVVLEQSPSGFLEANKSLIDDKTILVSSPPPVGAVCWVYKRQDVYLLMGGGELDYGLSYADSKHRLLNFRQFEDLIEKNRGIHHVVLIADSDRFADWRNELPQPDMIKTTGKGGFTLACYSCTAK